MTPSLLQLLMGLERLQVLLRSRQYLLLGKKVVAILISDSKARSMVRKKLSSPMYQKTIRAVGILKYLEKCSVVINLVEMTINTVRLN